MKKIIFIFGIAFVTLFTLQNVKASTGYQSFQDIRVYGGELVEDMSSSEINQEINKVSKRKFFGWNSNIKNENLKAYYITDTLFSYENKGTSSIKYNFSYKDSNVEKRNLTVTGDLGISFKGKTKKFSGGLDAEISGKYSQSEETEIEKKWELDLVVDPNTKATLKIRGQGKVTNGSAAKYFFFIRTKSGMFEEFIVTTEYYKLEVDKI